MRAVMRAKLNGTEIFFDVEGPKLRLGDSREPRELERSWLGGAPEPSGHPVLVQVDEPEHAMIDEQHVSPGADVPDRPLQGSIPAGDAGHAAGVTLLVGARGAQHGKISVGFMQRPIPAHTPSRKLRRAPVHDRAKEGVGLFASNLHNAREISE